MSKSGAPSASASASVSASTPSTHDPHSLPPNVKGLVQRYLAVSLPTITLTPEVIDVLDRSGIIIPSKIQVTMRWWKEDNVSSLSVYPKLNSPLPDAVEKRQRHLRQQRHLMDKQQQQQQKQQQQQQQHRLLHQSSVDSMPSGSNARSSTPAQAQSSSQQAQSQTQPQPQAQPRTSFLKRPWAGARLLNVFRKSKAKSKDSTVTLAATATADSRDTPTPTPMHPDVSRGAVRCALEQLQSYFRDMTTLTLEIQITPQLSAMATVTNLTDLFRNINGTFHGVFPFSTILQNDDPRLVSEKLLRKKVVLGMVVFQSWLQDTSDVNESDDESDSISINSMALLANNAPGGTPHLPHHMHNQNHQRQQSQHVPLIQQPPIVPPHRLKQQALPPSQFPHPSQPSQQPHQQQPPPQPLPPSLPSSLPQQQQPQQQRPQLPSVPSNLPLQQPPHEFDRLPHRTPQHPHQQQHQAPAPYPIPHPATSHYQQSPMQQQQQQQPASQARISSRIVNPMQPGPVPPMQSGPVPPQMQAGRPSHDQWAGMGSDTGSRCATVMIHVTAPAVMPRFNRDLIISSSSSIIIININISSNSTHLWILQESVFRSLRGIMHVSLQLRLKWAISHINHT
ncbi:hypothetical protein BGZ98_000819 [Dissophora globulifera]|nr:hypothetical protein BGZ98_000819 [Dissophora globulifera]